MSDYIILTDSSCDLPDKTIKKLGISVVPLSILIDDMTYYNYADESEISFARVYELLRQEKVVTTSAVNTTDFETTMEAFLQQGKDILYLGFPLS